MARAFKPLPVVLDLVYKNFTNYKNLIFIYGEKWKNNFKGDFKRMGF